jgi:hypothetical protein
MDDGLASSRSKSLGMYIFSALCLSQTYYQQKIRRAVRVEKSGNQSASQSVDQNDGFFQKDHNSIFCISRHPVFSPDNISSEKPNGLFATT